MEMPKVPSLTNHAPVSVSFVASAIASIVIALAKAKYGIDLSGQEANVTIVAGAIAGYLTSRGRS
jgi:energy-converting hydrogenase Eha subunit A